MTIRSLYLKHERVSLLLQRPPPTTAVPVRRRFPATTAAAELNHVDA